MRLKLVGLRSSSRKGKAYRSASSLLAVAVFVGALLVSGVAVVLLWLSLACLRLTTCYVKSSSPLVLFGVAPNILGKRGFLGTALRGFLLEPSPLQPLVILSQTRFLLVQGLERFSGEASLEGLLQARLTGVDEDGLLEGYLRVRAVEL